MSMVRARYHLDNARSALAVAMNHLRQAEAADVDPEVARKVYADMRTGLHAIDLYCIGLIASRQPDLDRETAAIDAAREEDPPCR